MQHQCSKLAEMMLKDGSTEGWTDWLNDTYCRFDETNYSSHSKIIFVWKRTGRFTTMSLFFSFICPRASQNAPDAPANTTALTLHFPPWRISWRDAGEDAANQEWQFDEIFSLLSHLSQSLLASRSPLIGCWLLQGSLSLLIG